MSKYEPLGKYLKSTGKSRVNLTFAKIESILGFKLPDSLYKYKAVWRGTDEVSKTHVWKVVWCKYGYQVETVDLTARNVIFHKV
jgi:hypothetical protein